MVEAGAICSGGEIVRDLTESVSHAAFARHDLSFRRRRRTEPSPARILWRRLRNLLSAARGWTGSPDPAATTSTEVEKQPSSSSRCWTGYEHPTIDSSVGATVFVRAAEIARRLLRNDRLGLTNGFSRTPAPPHLRTFVLSYSRTHAPTHPRTPYLRTFVPVSPRTSRRIRGGCRQSVRAPRSSRRRASGRTSGGRGGSCR
jgi:hypothetical protein